MKRKHAIPTTFAVLLAGALLFAGCESRDDASSADDGESGDEIASSDVSAPGGASDAELAESEHPLKEIEITGNDRMKFDKESLTAKPGQPLEITFENVGTMPKASMGHNWVLLEKDVDGSAFTEAGFASARNEYILPDREDEVLARTAILGPGESETVTFNAPSEPGDYEYVCTFPGHFAAGMKGVLTVE